MFNTFKPLQGKCKCIFKFYSKAIQVSTQGVALTKLIWRICINLAKPGEIFIKIQVWYCEAVNEGDLKLVVCIPL